MDLRIREFLDQIIFVVNTYDDIPLEARRLALESAMYNCERAANKAIQKQNEEKIAKVSQELSDPQQDNNIQEIQNSDS